VSANVRVLIVARDDGIAAPLGQGLDQLGWRTVTARGVQAAQVALQDLPIEAALVIADGIDSAVEVAGRLKAQRLTRPLPIVGVRTDGDDLDQHGFDMTLAAACHPSQVALRLEQLVRAAAAEEEFALRRQTFAEHGGELRDPGADASRFRVLAVGEPAPSFLSLAHALRNSGAEVTAAFTAYTAFDYLHERAFDAVVLWAGGAQAEALSIAAGMRRNSRLYHVPTVLYLRSRQEIDPAVAYRRGLTDIATAETRPEEGSRRIVGLARAYRRDLAIRRALEQARGAGLTDATTGLFTPELFAAHLGRLAGATLARGRPLSIAVLRIAERPDIARLRAGGWLARAMPQIGSMIGRLVRAEDSAGHLAPEVFGLALPGADTQAAISASERIAAVIACTAFQAGVDQRPFTVEFEIGAAEVRPGEAASRALERAAAQVSARQAS
jgi:two-component system, cell cycle response regulator PopA